MRFVKFPVIFVLLLLSVSIGHAGELDFDTGAVYRPEDPTVENTYKMPDVDAGFVYDSTTTRIRGVLALEVMDSISVPFTEYPMKTNIGAGEDLAFISATIRFTSIIEFSAGVFAGYDSNRERGVAGPIILLTKF